MRRRLLDAEAEAEGCSAGPQQQPAGVSGRRADATWLDSLPPPRTSSQPHAQPPCERGGQPGVKAGGAHSAALQQANGTHGAGSSGQAAAGSPRQHSGRSGMHGRDSGGVGRHGAGGSGSDSEEGANAGPAGAGASVPSDLAEALEGVEPEAGSSGEEAGQGSQEGAARGYEVGMREWDEEVEESEEEGLESDDELEEEEEEGPLLQVWGAMGEGGVQACQRSLEHHCASQVNHPLHPMPA